MRVYSVELFIVILYNLTKFILTLILISCNHSKNGDTVTSIIALLFKTSRVNGLTSIESDSARLAAVHYTKEIVPYSIP